MRAGRGSRTRRNQPVPLPPPTSAWGVATLRTRAARPFLRPQTPKGSAFDVESGHAGGTERPKTGPPHAGVYRREDGWAMNGESEVVDLTLPDEV